MIFLVGVWVGFIVLDGATYLLLVLILTCNYALPHANALKVLLIAVTTLVPILMFGGAGDIAWAEGGVLAAGSLLGGHAGALLSNRAEAKKWAFRLLVAVILLELVHLAWHYTGSLRAGRESSEDAGGRQSIYRDDRDRLAWLDYLSQACQRTGWRVYGWVLMGNHYHLLVETPGANLVSGMQWLQSCRQPIRFGSTGAMV